MEHRISLKRNARWIMGVVIILAGCAVFVFHLAKGKPEDGLEGALILVCLGGFFAGCELLFKYRAERLVKTGRYVWAEVIAVKEDVTNRSNRKHAYRLTVRQEIPGGGQRHFESHSLYLPEGVYAMGAKVRVYIGEKPEVYYVDVSSLLNEAE